MALAGGDVEVVRGWIAQIRILHLQTLCAHRRLMVNLTLVTPK